MGVIEDTYADLDADVSEERFREAVASKVEGMEGLVDEETAAMLIVHELDEGEVEGIADIESGIEEVKFLGKVQRIGEVRTFERDDDSEGTVLNVEVADEPGSSESPSGTNRRRARSTNSKRARCSGSRAARRTATTAWR